MLRSKLKIFQDSKSQLLILILLMIFNAAIMVINPLILKYLIDVVIPLKDSSQLFKIAGFMIALFVVGSIVTFSLNTLSLFLIDKVSLSYKQKIVGHTLDLDMLSLSEMNIGKLKNIINKDSYIVISFLLKKMLPLIAEIFNFTFILIVLISLNLKLTLISICFLPVYFILYHYAGKKIEKGIPFYYKIVDEISQFVLQTLAGIEIIKIFSKEKRQKEKYKRICNDYLKSELKLNMISSFAQSVSIIFGNFFSFGIFLYATYLIFEDIISLGLAVAFFSYLSKLLSPVKLLSSLSVEYKRFSESFSRIESHLELRPQIINENQINYPDFKDKIVLRDASFAYDKSNRFIEKINFEIPKNKTISLVGKSGSGKSTIAKLLIRLYDLDQGEILIDGLNIKQIKIEDLHQLVGYVPQDSFLFNTTIRENILFGNPNATQKELEAVCKMANIYDFIVSLEKKFETVVGEKGIKISGGEKQRISLARTLIKNPRIVIFDEATSNLDSESENIIQNAIQKLSHKMTIIIIDHRLTTVVKSDNIIVLENGSILESGTHLELLKKGGLYSDLWQESNQNLNN